MADQAVLAAQRWVNETYSGRTGYSPVNEDGLTGWSTMYALTKALQLELGITATSNNFGAGTLSALERQYSVIGSNVNDHNANVVKIIQSALYCKGYGPGAINGTYGPGTTAAVSSMQQNMGVLADGKVTPKIFKALLTMDAYVTLVNYGGTEKIREIQQWLNNRYIHRKNFFIQPTDGVYSRGTQQALIYAIQYEEGLSDSVANGNFGPTTRNNLPTLQVGSQDGATQFVHLLQAALCFNGYDVDFDGIFGTGTKNVVMNFQSFSMLPSDGIVGLGTWSSLLVSTGDPNRKGTALDCVTEITPARAETLVNAGYETVGRYLTNVEGTTLNKKIQPGELETIFNAGMTVFPIYQTYGGAASYFNATQGGLDAIAAHNAAKSYGFPDNTIIYFAVDYDSTDDEITRNILPHFAAVYSKLTELGSYRVGIYGTRNACSRVSNAGYAVTSFVSSMSTGFSGNLGFPLPKNWAFDQISTITLGSGDGAIEIDNNIKSGRDSGVSKVIKTDESIIEEALKNTVVGIYPLSAIFNTSLEMDGNSHVLSSTPYYRLEYKASRSLDFGEGNATNTITVSEGKPDLSVNLVNILSSSDSMASELEMDMSTEQLIYTLSSNIGEGFISSYLSISSALEVEYNIEITTPITVSEGVIITPKIIFTLVFKNPDNPSAPNLVPVETVEPYAVTVTETTEAILKGVAIGLVGVGTLILIAKSGGLATKPALSGAGVIITALLSTEI